MEEELFFEAKKVVDRLNPKRIKRYAIDQLYKDLCEINNKGSFISAEEVVNEANREGVLPTKRIHKNRGGSVLMKVIHFHPMDDIGKTEDTLYCLIPTSYKTKSIVRVAKALFGFTGHRGESVSYGNEIDISLRNREDIIFVQFPEYLPRGTELTDITSVRKTYATNLKKEVA